MSARMSRRVALKSGAAAGLALGLGDLSFVARLRPLAASELKLRPQSVRLRPETEPLVRFIEETPRDELLEQVADRIRRGLSYQELLAALLLAGVKNVEPRPSVGFKFHTVLVVNSAHLASMASAPEHRWLPIFWALDYYKSAAARDVEERGDWTMPMVDESALPQAHRASRAFTAAMDSWDEAAADTAVARLARSSGVNEIYELFFRYGARDFRSIGHKAIYVANSYRTLQCIGVEHGEPVMRSLAYALLAHEGDNPAKRDAEADRSFRQNLELVTKIRPDWRDGSPSSEATREFLTILRTESNDVASEQAVKLLNRGVAAQSLWDALQVGAGELLLRQPGIVALHAVTTTNALLFAFLASCDDETRRLVLLQNAAFLPMFREAMGERGRLKDLTVDDLMDTEVVSDDSKIDTIFAELGRDPLHAARQAKAYLNGTTAEGAEKLIDAARLLVFLKGDDAHDYKFSSAILEDYYHVSPGWRDTYLALNVCKLKSSLDHDNPLTERTRAALKA